MHALVFHKPHDIRFERMKDPVIEAPRDAIVRVTSTAICGSDLHIYNGLVPQTKPSVLGHEFMGIVEEVGAGVPNLKPGDRVIVPCPDRELFGYTDPCGAYQGGQAEYV